MASLPSLVPSDELTPSYSASAPAASNPSSGGEDFLDRVSKNVNFLGSQSQTVSFLLAVFLLVVTILLIVFGAQMIGSDATTGGLLLAGGVVAGVLYLLMIVAYARNRGIASRYDAVVKLLTNFK